MIETADIRQPERAVTGEAKGYSLHSLVTPPTPYHEQDGIRIFCGDNRVIAPTLGQYDCLHTDPPKCNIRLLHIDLNCAAAEIVSFQQAIDRGFLRIGAIVVLDDYGYAGGGETFRAWNAFAELKGIDIVSLPTGQGMFIL